MSILLIRERPRIISFRRDLQRSFAFFGVRRFTAAFFFRFSTNNKQNKAAVKRRFFLSVFNEQQAKQSGGKAPHSKKGKAAQRNPGLSRSAARRG